MDDILLKFFPHRCTSLKNFKCTKFYAELMGIIWQAIFLIKNSVELLLKQQQLRQLGETADKCANVDTTPISEDHRCSAQRSREFAVSHMCSNSLSIRRFWLVEKTKILVQFHELSIGWSDITLPLEFVGETYIPLDTRFLCLSGEWFFLLLLLFFFKLSLCIFS